MVATIIANACQGKKKQPKNEIGIFQVWRSIVCLCPTTVAFIFIST
jgi:hypothetical protein